MLKNAAMFSIIVALDENNGIGKNNKLLAHLPNDLKWFKKQTLGHTIIMGRHTYESLPNGALPGRRNIVLSKIIKELPGVIVVSSLDELHQIIEDDEENFVIGGGQIYKLFLPLASKLYITRIHHIFEADVFFPEIDFNQWIEVYHQYNPADSKNKFAHSFIIYKRKN